MSIISKDLIENVQAKDMNQIFKMNPTTQENSRTSNNLGDFQNVIIRGFQTNNPIINGIPYSDRMGSTPMMQDIERVEIINGATGFLYGGGRVGGAVNYITKKPTTKDLRNITIGSYGNESYYTHLDLSGQFDDNHTFGYRVNGFYQDGELPSEVDSEQKAISLVFDWKPTDNFYTDIKYSYKNLLNKGVKANFNTATNRNQITKYHNYSPDWVEYQAKSNKVENNIIWDINDIFTLRTNAFYQESKIKSTNTNITYDNNAIVGGMWKTYFIENAWNKADNYGANIFLDSKFDTGNIGHTLTTGYSLNSSKTYLSDDNFRTYHVLNNITLDELNNLSKPDWDSIGTIGTQSQKPSSKTQYKNILIGDDIVFNEQWSALVGVNYASLINKTYSTNTKYDKSELTPTLSLIYKPFENLTTYATYIESLEDGGQVPNTVDYNDAGKFLDPFVSKQYEIGAKYTLNEKVLINTALFRIERANSFDETASNGKKNRTQDGENIYQGIELGITGKVTDNLTIMAGGTIMDLSVEKATNKSLEGKKPTGTATKMAKIFAEYNIPYINGLSINAGAYYTGEKYIDSANTRKLPSSTIYDAGIRYKTKLDKYPTTFNLNVQNLTDEVYWTNQTILGDPRAVAFSMKMEF
ncbi:TonB-dependent siderophore receptor [Aliarcobacter vitoriensis]|uniref:TonB-dependent siderophore receptor n=1 Tax=Aliarcobacter vitoriensis TaxID=2011099 RepID=UPI003AAFC48C